MLVFVSGQAREERKGGTWDLERAGKGTGGLEQQPQVSKKCQIDVEMIRRTSNVEVSFNKQRSKPQKQTAARSNTFFPIACSCVRRNYMKETCEGAR